MGKSLFIAEKPSVAQEFAKALKVNVKKQNGYLEGDQVVITWCVGHLVTMSYPECYDKKYKKWSLDTLPFLPEEFLYEVIPGVSKQYQIVAGLLNRADISTIYVCTDSGREGEYIYRLVEQMAKPQGKIRKRVWIDSQTEEEINRGIKEAKDLSEYDALSDAAYLRAKEDYLMGINFSRALSLKYGNVVARNLKEPYVVISVGRVMTCVLGMIVRREREIRNFIKTPFYRVLGSFSMDEGKLEGEWKAVEGSRYYQSPLLYKENGFLKREDAHQLIESFGTLPVQAEVLKAEKKKEVKNPPLLFNLAELQNECSKLFKISPDETLKIVQELYEKKLVTYPRTDARVLSTAVAKEIYKNISGLRNYGPGAEYAEEILAAKTYQKIAQSRYVNDKQITDHYAMIPTGQGLPALRSVSATAEKVYELILRRFLSIFYPPAEYQKIGVTIGVGQEKFFANTKILVKEGYLKVAVNSFEKKKTEGDTASEGMDILKHLKKGSKLSLDAAEIKEGETTPPKRYNSGTIILAMENAGQFIEDEELRAQIKGSGIGTSATRAEILKKLINNNYISLNKKSQILTPKLLGEMIFDVVSASIAPLLRADLTASWEKGLTGVAEGNITKEEYMEKLEGFVSRCTYRVLQSQNQNSLQPFFDAAARYYKK